MVKPNCSLCVHMQRIADDCHISCAARNITVKGDPIGVRKGWFVWPFNFDPTWLLECDGYTEQENDDADTEG